MSRKKKRNSTDEAMKQPGQSQGQPQQGNENVDKKRLLWGYAGSKYNLSRWHVTLFPQVKWYVSVFGGTGSEFLWRKPEGLEVLNDLDTDVHNAFSVIRDPKQCAAMKELLLATPDGRRQFLECKKAMDDPDPVRRAWAFLMVANTGDVRGPVRKRSWFTPRLRLHHLPECLDWWRERMRRVKLECLPWQLLIDRYDREDALLYCDPP